MAKFSKSPVWRAIILQLLAEPPILFLAPGEASLSNYALERFQ
jgi:hypothetical protein